MTNRNAVKKWRCINYGICDKADAREVVEVNVGEESICPSCKEMLIEVKKTTLPKWVIPIVTAIALIGVGAGVFFYTNKDVSDDVEKSEVVELVETTVTSDPEEADKTVEQETPVLAVDGQAIVTKDLGFAVWVGKVKAGKPHDVQGTLTFKSKHIIDSRDGKGRTANSGDKVIGTFENGHLTQGKWYKSDGNVESIILGSGGND